MRLANFLKSQNAHAELYEVATGLSHAEIAGTVTDAIKEAVMQLGSSFH